MTRTIQRNVARALIAALLIVQMMVAAYACPVMSPEGAAKGMSAASHPVVAFSDTTGMPDGCDGMTFDSPNLCAAHCQAGDQNIDPGQAIGVPANPVSSFYVVQIPSASSGSERNSIPSEFVNAIPPPHAILHCCFRI